MKNTGLVLLVLFAGFACADRGMIPLARPDISVYEPGQKAIIAWNGDVERMVLVTDVNTSEPTRVLGIIPFPSVPEVSRAEFGLFATVETIIQAHAPARYQFDRGPSKDHESLSSVELLFQKEIGAHSLTAVRAQDYEAFLKWTQDFLDKNGVKDFELSPELTAIVARYIADSLNCFVFDIVSCGPSVQSVEPLLYEFASDRLYYPLRISSIVEGHTDITLITLTRHIPAVWLEDSPLQMGFYRVRNQPVKPIVFKLEEYELKKIFTDAEQFFPRRPYLSVLRYQGPASGLFADLNTSLFLRPFSIRER